MMKVNTKEELKDLIQERIDKFSYNCDLNDIDVSNITNMSHLFYGSKFNGDISNWNVSNVRNMSCMFECSQFNGDISDWDISNVTNMAQMFNGSEFNQNINSWRLNEECKCDHGMTNRSFKNMLLTNRLKSI